MKHIHWQWRFSWKWWMSFAFDCIAAFILVWAINDWAKSVWVIPVVYLLATISSEVKDE